VTAEAVSLTCAPAGAEGAIKELEVRTETVKVPAAVGVCVPLELDETAAAGAGASPRSGKVVELTPANVLVAS